MQALGTRSYPRTARAASFSGNVCDPVDLAPLQRCGNTSEQFLLFSFWEEQELLSQHATLRLRTIWLFLTFRWKDQRRTWKVSSIYYPATQIHYARLGIPSELGAVPPKPSQDLQFKHLPAIAIDDFLVGHALQALPKACIHLFKLGISIIMMVLLLHTPSRSMCLCCLLDALILTYLSLLMQRRCKQASFAKGPGFSDRQCSIATKVAWLR